MNHTPLEHTEKIQQRWLVVRKVRLAQVIFTTTTKQEASYIAIKQFQLEACTSAELNSNRKRTIVLPYVDNCSWKDMRQNKLSSTSHFARKNTWIRIWASHRCFFFTNKNPNQKRFVWTSSIAISFNEPDAKAMQLVLYYFYRSSNVNALR